MKKKKKDLKLSPKKKTDPNILLAERKIEEHLGLKVKITKKINNSGKLTIEYSNLDQFELLSTLLSKK